MNSTSPTPEEMKPLLKYLQALHDEVQRVREAPESFVDDPLGLPTIKESQMAKLTQRQFIEIMNAAPKLVRYIRSLESSLSELKRENEKMRGHLEYLRGAVCEDHNCSCFGFDANTLLSSLSSPESR